MIKPPLRILCADDNVYVRQLLEETLRSRGDEVETAADGKQALAKLRNTPHRFDLLITDTQMPGLDGFGLAEQARAAGYDGDMIVFASPMSADEKQRYLALGVSAIVDKPGGTALLQAVGKLR